MVAAEHPIPTQVFQSDSRMPSLMLPDIEAVDVLDGPALVEFLTRLGALAHRAQARLTLVTAPAPPSTSDYSVSGYLTAEQVAHFLNAELKWVHRHARMLGGVKLDGLLRFSRRRLEAYLARQQRLAG
jgi:hypothetical protein